ncbi:MAG: Trk system potassium transporter TrkA [Candidatus Gastranaerophilales bacterium]|nr:Trk system potassium transporter TrkA [Candidatus Gastranaerophilales bacterium]
MRIVIFGANELGCLIATELFEDHDITIIDKEENRSDDFNKLDISFVHGNGSNIKVLETAQIQNADVFIACTDMEEANIVACLTAKSMSPVKTVCFVKKQEYLESLSLVKGSKYQAELLIDHVIWPEELLTQEIFRIITVPNAIDVENFAQGKARLFEYRIKEESKILNKTIKDCCFPDETLIVGITRDAKLFIPDGETTLELNDKVIFMGSAYSLDILAGEFFQRAEMIKSVSIIGGGSVGMMLAQNLEKMNIRTKIIEKDYKRCEFLTENLKKTLVLHGDGTNLELLESESIGESEVVVSVTNNDEKNLLCSLLAKQLGVSKIITRVSKDANAALFEKVGIDVAVSPNEAAIDEIENHLIETDVDILATVERGQGEIIEITVPQKFEYKRIMDLQLPVKAIIAIIQRWNKVIIPKGTTHVMANDNLIIFTTKENSNTIKEFFKKA